jgi:hypothetical protein
MKKIKTSIPKLAGDAVLLGAVMFANKILDKTEKRMNAHPFSDKQLQRKLTITSIVYHAIGIFYNE